MKFISYNPLLFNKLINFYDIYQVSFLLSVPNFINYEVQRVLYLRPIGNTSNYSQEFSEECLQKKDAFANSLIQWYSMVISYLVPSCVLIICYIKILMYMSSKAKRLAHNAYNGRVSVYRKRKVTRTVVFLTLTFIVLWFPVHFLATWYRLDKNFPQSPEIYLLKLAAHTMSYANSTVNPLIYGFSNESFRLSLSHFMRKFMYKKKLSMEIGGRSKRTSAKDESIQLTNMNKTSQVMEPLAGPR
jgi:hypothetical protein